MEPVATGKAQQYPCPSCGAGTTLFPGTSNLVCAHCGAVTPIGGAAAPVFEHDFREALRRSPPRRTGELVAGGRQVECKTCGARTVVAGHAGRCPFCDGTLVVEAAVDDEMIAPESILPFGIAQERAAELFQGWLGKRWFAPSDLVARARKDALDGVYLPYWTYDAETTTRYQGQRGEHYYETIHTTDAKGNPKTERVRKTRWYPASGTVHNSFDDILVCASPSLPRKLVEKLEPWDLPQLVAFDGRYLAGFIAERYRVDLEQGFAIAEERMEPTIRSTIERDIGGDEQRIHSMVGHHDQVRFKHLLLPLWISSFRYRDKVYRVIVNARSGEVSGERPWSWVKIALLTLVMAAVVAGIGYLVMASRSA